MKTLLLLSFAVLFVSLDLNAQSLYYSGLVYQEGRVIGEIRDNGSVYQSGRRIWEVKGAFCRHRVAAFYFFFFTEYLEGGD